MKKVSQLEKVKTHLLTGAALTPLEALDQYNSLRLGSIIHRLKRDPHNMTIESHMVKVASGKRVARYSVPNWAAQP